MLGVSGIVRQSDCLPPRKVLNVSPKIIYGTSVDSRTINEALRNQSGSV